MLRIDPEPNRNDESDRRVVCEFILRLTTLIAFIFIFALLPQLFPMHRDDRDTPYYGACACDARD